MTQDTRPVRARAALLDAALQLWSDAGWAAVTPAAVCAATGLGEAVFRAEFASAEDLLVEIFDEGTEERAAMVLVAMDAAGPGRGEQIHACLDAFASCLERDPRQCVVLVEAIGCPPLRARRRRANVGFSALIAGETSKIANPPSAEKVQVAAQFCLGGLAELTLAWLDETSPVTREQLVEHGTRLFESALMTR
ncbi:MAG: TetR/AcrR family transcriptional regulator [Pseudonocardia sp.]|nr:TetR/AcrR family transcriptional regulator [Pseudonocardia sp.]